MSDNQDNTQISEYTCLYPYQVKILNTIIIDEYYTRRPSSKNEPKAWESSYDPRYNSKPVKSSPLPPFSSLPAGRSVTLQKKRLPEDFKDIKTTILPWIKEMNLKLQCQSKVKDENGAEADAFVFKRTKDALIFKLTWG